MQLPDIRNLRGDVLKLVWSPSFFDPIVAAGQSGEAQGLDKEKGEDSELGGRNAQYILCLYVCIYRGVHVDIEKYRLTRWVSSPRELCIAASPYTRPSKDIYHKPTMTRPS